MRGRKPPGPEIVERLQGPDEAKERWQLILETLTDRRRVREAARRLGISVQRFHVLRTEALQGGLDALMARPPGRPRQETTPEQQRIAALEQELENLRQELTASRVREEINLGLPRRPAPDEEKKSAPPRRRRSRKPRPPPREPS
jgi:transposase-like protein